MIVGPAVGGRPAPLHTYRRGADVQSRGHRKQ